MENNTAAVPTIEEPSLSKLDIARAWTNDPALAKDEFAIGRGSNRKVFKVVDLGWNEYCEFIAHLQPLFDMFTSFLAAKGGEQLKDSIPGIELKDLDVSLLSPTNILKFLKDEVPHLVAIICNNTDKSVDVEWVIKNIGSPLNAATIIIKQIKQNNMIADVASFFADLLPLIVSEKK